MRTTVNLKEKFVTSNLSPQDFHLHKCNIFYSVHLSSRGCELVGLGIHRIIKKNWLKSNINLIYLVGNNKSLIASKTPSHGVFVTLSQDIMFVGFGGVSH